jgi:hypothetical protein
MLLSLAQSSCLNAAGNALIGCWQIQGVCAVFTGLHPSTWPLPLTREGLHRAAQDPTPQPMPNAGKRAIEDAKGPVSAPYPASLCLHAALFWKRAER